jgi:hypothetical protein
MKNQITQFSFIIIAFIALTFLMSYTRPVADEPKEYIVIINGDENGLHANKFDAEINQKLTEGWRPQGGVCMYGSIKLQAMVK